MNCTTFVFENFVVRERNDFFVQSLSPGQRFFVLRHAKSESGFISPGLNFINVLRTAFTLVDPKSVKNTVMS